MGVTKAPCQSPVTPLLLTTDSSDGKNVNAYIPKAVRAPMFVAGEDDVEDEGQADNGWGFHYLLVRCPLLTYYNIHHMMEILQPASNFKIKYLC